MVSCCLQIIIWYIIVNILLALDHLGFGDYREQAEEVVKDCKSKRRRQSTRLENLGIPEEELLRQQQELFAKVSKHLVNRKKVF